MLSVRISSECLIISRIVSWSSLQSAHFVISLLMNHNSPPTSYLYCKQFPLHSGSNGFTSVASMDPKDAEAAQEDNEKNNIVKQQDEGTRPQGEVVQVVTC